MKDRPNNCLFDHGAENGVWAGLYSVHLRRWKAHFPKIHVMTSELFFEKPREHLISTMRFIGLDPWEMDGIDDAVSRRYNTKSTKRRAPVHQQLHPEVREALASFFRPYNDELRIEFGVDISQWSTMVQ